MKRSDKPPPWPKERPKTTPKGSFKGRPGDGHDDTPGHPANAPPRPPPEASPTTRPMPAYRSGLPSGTSTDPSSRTGPASSQLTPTNPPRLSFSGHIDPISSDRFWDASASAMWRALNTPPAASNRSSGPVSGYSNVATPIRDQLEAHVDAL